MTTTPPGLHDELARLAERTGAEPGPTGGELWDRGTRYRRRLRVGTAAIAAGTVLGLAVLTGVAVDRAGPPLEPAPADAPAGLPSRIWSPSPWLPGTDEVGPPGQVIAMGSATRRTWRGTTSGIVTVSAATGDYRFLDLPGWTAGWAEEPTLAPDGRHVAYWAAGPVTGTPNTGDGGGAPLSRVAVYDTVDGTLARHTFASEHGLSPNTMAWVDATTLVVSHYQLAVGDEGPSIRQSMGVDQTTWLWDIAAPEPERWDEGTRQGVDDWGVPVDGHVAVRGFSRLKDLDPDTRTLRPLPRRLPIVYGSGNAISPDGTRIAGVWRQPDDRTPNDVVVVPLDSPRAPRRLETADAAFRVDGWIDDESLVVTRRSEPVRRGLGMGVYRVDALTGDTEPLVRLPDGSFGTVQWASALLDSPVVDRPAPPTPLDPRWVAAGWTSIAFAGLLALWGWRRRVTP